MTAEFISISFSLRSNYPPFMPYLCIIEQFVTHTHTRACVHKTKNKTIYSITVLN